MQINPKSRFLASQHAKDYTDRIAADWFQVASESAFAEYATRLGTQATPQASWDAHNRLVGAKEFLNCLLNLGIPGDKIPRSESHNMDYSKPKPLENPKSHDRHT